MITAVLSLIDFYLIANLLLIVMFSGYENFISRLELDDQKYKPAWMGHVGFGELKLKLLTSIVAISAVHLLESFMNIDQTGDRELGWSIVLKTSLADAKEQALRNALAGAVGSDPAPPAAGVSA